MYQDGLLLDLAWTGNKSFKIMAKARLENVAEQPYHGFFPIVIDAQMNLFCGNKRLFFLQQLHAPNAVHRSISSF